MDKRERFLAALHGEAVDRPPVWLMRQAGRYLPGYRAVRAQHDFWTVCKTPALSTEVALEPLALFPLDAAIVFSDILVVPDALGMGVSFDNKGEGPQIKEPLRTRATLEKWQVKEARAKLAFVSNAARHLQESLHGSHGLVGFAGAPFTLFAYMAEGSGSDDFRHARALMYEDPKLVKDALHTIAGVVADLLADQFAAGVDAVQLFDTWGGLLTREEYLTFAVPALRHIVDKLQGKPVLLYAKNAHHLLPVLGETGVSGLSLDWRTPISEARALYPRHILQGNIDPVLLFAPEAAVRERTRALIAESRGTRFIVNLGHGILPGTPPGAVAALCEEVVRAR
jgi:uroporphyrinogen decarboxylase